MAWKKFILMLFFPLFLLDGIRIKDTALVSVNTKNFSSNVLKISEISLVLHTRKITDIFNIFDEINLVFNSKK